MPIASHDDPLALRPIPHSVRRWLYLLIWLLPTTLTLAMVFAGIHADHSYMAFRGRDSLTSMVATMLVVGVVTLAIAWVMARALRWHALRLDADTLHIATGFYRKHLPLATLDLGKARNLDLDEHPQFKPLLKTNGIRVPGYTGGHFRLRNREKAFCALADRGRVLYLPIRAGGAVLLGCARPDAALHALREAAGV